MKLNFRTKTTLTFSLISAIALVSATTFSTNSSASSIFVGHASTERVVTVGESLQDLSPSGLEVFLNYDVNDNWSVNIDYSKLEDDELLAGLINLDYEIDSLGLGVSYFGDDWGLFYQFTDFEEQQDTYGSRPNAPGAVRHNQGNSHSLSASYFISLNDHWQLSTSLGLHYNDWDESNNQILSQAPDDGPQNPPTQDDPLPPASGIEESGDASLISLATNINRYSILSENTGMTFGVFVGWNEVLNSQSELRSVNNRNINPVRGGGDRGGANNNFVITGSESYGIASVYLSFDFYQNWVLDIDTNTDFGAGDRSQTWSISVGYLF